MPLRRRGRARSSAALVLPSVLSLAGVCNAQVQRGPAPCASMGCPDGFDPKPDMDDRSCVNPECRPDVDRDRCCDERCAGSGADPLSGFRCPIRYLPKAGAVDEHRCLGDCDSSDLWRCCNMVANCAGFPCPASFVPKPEPSEQYCRDLLCDPVLDLDSCCNQQCSTFQCSERSRAKPNASTTYCAGSCDNLRDRETCCDFVPAVSESGQLGRAAIVSDTRKVDRLVAMGAQLSDRDRTSSALHFAALQNNAQVIDRLADSGADLDAQDAKGWAALHVAAGRGHVAVVSRLVARRADPLLKTHSGQTPRDIMMRAHALKVRPPHVLEDVLVAAERARADENHLAQKAHLLRDSTKGFPVQRGIQVWLSADYEDSLDVQPDGRLRRWVDQAGNGRDAVPLDGGMAPSLAGHIGGLPAVSFAPGEMLRATRECMAKTVVVVMQHRSVNPRAEIFGEFGSSFALRIWDLRWGHHRQKLGKDDWQWRQPHKLWLNGDNTVLRWEGFPEAPVVLVGVKRSGRGDGQDFVYRLAASGGGLDALIGEVLVYDRELSEHEVLEVTGHLANKWGISSPASGVSAEL